MGAIAAASTQADLHATVPPEREGALCRFEYGLPIDSFEEPPSWELYRIALAFVMNREILSIDELRMLYLFGPVQFESHDGGRIFHVRTSLEAALKDVRIAVGRDQDGNKVDRERAGYWLGASAYLMVLDQLASVMNYRGFEGLLTSEVGGLSAEHAGALYGLRNAFVHTYGLTNEGPGGSDRRRLLRHVFTLDVGTADLVTVGDRTEVLALPLWQLPPTRVDLGRLADFAERLVREIRRRHMASEPLRWAYESVQDFGSQYFFWHTSSGSGFRSL